MFSIKTKIVSITTLLVLLGGLLATYIVFDTTKNNLYSIEKGHFETHSRFKARQPEIIFEIAESAVDYLSNDQTINEYISSLTDDYLNNSQAVDEGEIIETDDSVDKENQKEEKEIVAIDEEYIEEELSEVNLGNIFSIIYLMDKDGNVLASTDKSLMGNNYSFRDYFKGAVENGSYVDFSVGVTTGNAGYYFSKSIIKNNEVAGVVVGKMGANIVEKIISDGSLLDNTNEMLLDKMGVVIYSEDENKLYKSAGKLDKEDLELIRETKRYNSQGNVESLSYDFLILSIKEERGFILQEFFDDKDGEEELIAAFKLGKFPFYLVSEAEKEGFVKPAEKTGIFLASMVLITALLVGLAIMYLLNKFLRPIKELMVVSENIGRGDFSKRLDIKTSDEFGKLSETLNKSSEKLENFQKNLEKEVKERTRSLEELNKFMVGRELKMVELKKEIKNLKKEPDNNANQKNQES